MSAIDALLEELNPHTIVDNVSRKHENARSQYHLSRNTVRDTAEFTEVIGDYVQHVYRTCFIHGGWISRVDASGIAKELLDGPFTQREVDRKSVLKDCLDGLNGGVRRCLDILCEGLKRQAVERYIRDVFDRYLPEEDPDLRLRMVEEFIRRFGPLLPGIDCDRPWLYVKDIERLIKAVVQAAEHIASAFRSI